MTISGNSYTVEQIDRACKRAEQAIRQMPEGCSNSETLNTLINLYLGAIDADKEPQTKAVSA